MFDNQQGGTWGQASAGPQHQFLPAHEEFRGRLQVAWPSPAAEQAVTEAFAAYVAIMQEPWQSADLSKRLAEAHAEYTKRVREAFASGGDALVLDAYRDYVRHLKNVWMALDPDALAPEDLVAIGQGMTWVAGVALGVSAGRSPTEPRS
jgi:hypothetical protein